jgi:hypothetical protein
VRQALFGVPATAYHLRPGGDQDRVGRVLLVIADEFAGLAAEQARRQRIGENEWG